MLDPKKWSEPRVITVLRLSRFGWFCFLFNLIVVSLVLSTTYSLVEDDECKVLFSARFRREDHAERRVLQIVWAIDYHVAVFGILETTHASLCINIHMKERVTKVWMNMQYEDKRGLIWTYALAYAEEEKQGNTMMDNVSCVWCIEEDVYSCVVISYRCIWREMACASAGSSSRWSSWFVPCASCSRRMASCNRCVNRTNYRLTKRNRSAKKEQQQQYASQPFINHGKRWW